MTEKSIIERERHSGAVSWTDTEIEWQNPDGADVVINLADVVVIGEYITDAGPFFDDWFLVFVYKSGAWDSISVYADGIVDLKRYLSKIYSADLSKYFPGDPIGWRSYIRYRQDLEGSPLFVMGEPTGYKPARTFLDKLKSALGLGVYGKSWEFDLTNEVKSILKSAG